MLVWFSSLFFFFVFWLAPIAYAQVEQPIPKVFLGVWGTDEVRVSNYGLTADPALPLYQLRLSIKENRVSLQRVAEYLPLQICEAPNVRVFEGNFSAWFMEIYATDPGAFGFNEKDFEKLPRFVLKCKEGEIGPLISDGINLIPLPSGQLAINYFDGTFILLKRLEGQ